MSVDSLKTDWVMMKIELSLRWWQRTLTLWLMAGVTSDTSSKTSKSFSPRYSAGTNSVR